MNQETGNRVSRHLDRDDEILQHVMRYRLTTPAVLHRLFFADSERNAVTKVTSRMCDQELLASNTLYGSNVYFTLGRQGARRTGLRASLVKPMGGQTLYREFGILSYCCLGSQLRERQRFSEIFRKHPQLIAKHLDSSHYYLDRDAVGARRLAYVWVEAGGPADHIVRTVRQKILEPRLTIPTFRQLIEQGEFLVAIVTYHEEKQRQITEALAALRTTAVFRIEVFPELRNLLSGIR